MKRARQLAAVLILFGFRIIPSFCAYVGNPESIATRFGQAGEQGEEAKSIEGDGDNAPVAVATSVLTEMRSLRISVPYSQINETTKTEWRLKMEEIMRQYKKAKTTMTVIERYARDPILIQRRRRQQPAPNCANPMIVPFQDENGYLAFSISCPGLTRDQVAEYVRQNLRQFATALEVPENRIHVGYSSSTSLTAAVETSSTQAPAAVETSSTQAPAAVETSSTQAPAAVETSSTQAPAAVETSSTQAPAAVENSSTQALTSVETSSTKASTAVETSSTQASSGIAEKVVVASHVPYSLKDKTDPNTGTYIVTACAAVFAFWAICALLYYICTYQPLEKPPYILSNAPTEGEWNSAYKSDEETARDKAPTRLQEKENRGVTKKDELGQNEKRGVEDTKL